MTREPRGRNRLTDLLTREPRGRNRSGFPTPSNYLNKLYNDPQTGFIGQRALYDKAKLHDHTITLKQVRDFYKSQESIQKYQPQKKRFDEFKITSRNPCSWQIDLAFWFKKVILTGININSRVGFAQLLPNKQAKTILSAIKQFVKIHDVEVITSDNGSEFINQQVEKYFKDNQIEHYNSEAGDHNTLGKIERFNRTLKSRIMKMERPLTHKLLKDIISNYNNTKHTSINATPNEMQGQVIESEIQHNQKLLTKVDIEFSEGESVVYKLKQKTFGKESIRWSKVVYEVVGIDGFRIQIRSKNKHTLYKPPNELRKVNLEASEAPNEKNQIWEVKAILDHKKQRNGKYKYLIDWVGMEPTWEPQANLRLVNKNRRSAMEINYFSSM